MTTLAFFDRPSTGMLALALVCVAAAWAAYVAAEWLTRASIAEPESDRRPEPLEGATLEPPAVVGLLTNEFTAPRTAVTATALDLAARGWIRLATVEDELVVVMQASPSAGDSLRPFEQQVLNHLAARAFNDVSSANTLAASHHRLDRRWWWRFERAVARESVERGLSERRYSPAALVTPAAIALTGAFAWWFGARGGDEVAIVDSWQSRSVWLAVAVALVTVTWYTLVRALGGAQRPTAVGLRRASDWMGFRERLRNRIPSDAGVLAPPPQQQALAQAVVMGLTPQVLAQLPAAPEHPRLAWSEAGGTPHLVRVHYPFRPGFGQHPFRLMLVGVALLFAARWLQAYLRRVADGDALESLFERIPGQVDLVQDLAALLAVLCWLPLVWAAWAIVAGAIDAAVTRERIGAVVRARRPAAVLPPLLVTIVKPFAERDRFSTYIAVDDGKRRHVWAWMANERSAAPQGAQARVRATPMLGYVRSTEPVGTATRG